MFSMASDASDARAIVPSGSPAHNTGRPVNARRLYVITTSSRLHLNHHGEEGEGCSSENEEEAEWEFSRTNSKVFAGLAAAMRSVSAIFLIKALADNGTRCIGTLLLHPQPELIYPDIFGEFAEMFDYLFFAYFLTHASKSIQAIATTEGHDITCLMRGIAALRSFFKRLVIVGMILVFKGLATTTVPHLALLASEKKQARPLPVISSVPFGAVPPRWSLPLGLLSIAAFMVLLGRKSLRDEYRRIERRMQPRSLDE